MVRLANELSFEIGFLICPMILSYLDKLYPSSRRTFVESTVALSTLKIQKFAEKVFVFRIIFLETKRDAV